jgi:site-specific recombinase XerD
VTLAVIRSLDAPRRLASVEDAQDFEQELVDQYALAMVGAGMNDHHVSSDRSTLFAFVSFLGRPIWTAQPADADRYLAGLRQERGLSRQTVRKKAITLAQFFEFLVARYQGDIAALTGVVVSQPIDEFNRPVNPDYGAMRVPPPEEDVERLFEAWAAALPEARKYLPAARDYLAASLWRRAGLRITETVMLDIGDWRPDMGELGKLHVRFGKGSRGRGPKTRLVPCINGIDSLLEWWLVDVRHQFGDDWSDVSAPLLPSERRDADNGRCLRVGADALRTGLAHSVARWLPSWRSRLTPHSLRHFCASSLYAKGVDLKAIQDLLGHEWLSTTTRYIHVEAEHIEQAWKRANDRITARFTEMEA